MSKFVFSNCVKKNVTKNDYYMLLLQLIFAILDLSFINHYDKQDSFFTLQYAARILKHCMKSPHLACLIVVTTKYRSQMNKEIPITIHDSPRRGEHQAPPLSAASSCRSPSLWSSGMSIPQGFQRHDGLRSSCLGTAAPALEMLPFPLQHWLEPPPPRPQLCCKHRPAPCWRPRDRETRSCSSWTNKRTREAALRPQIPFFSPLFPLKRPPQPEQRHRQPPPQAPNRREHHKHH